MSWRSAITRVTKQSLRSNLYKVRQTGLVSTSSQCKICERYKSSSNGNGGNGNNICDYNGNNGDKDLSSFIHPVPYVPVQTIGDDIRVGEELTQQLEKRELMKLLVTFYRNEKIRGIAAENGLGRKLHNLTYLSFRKFCINSEVLPTDLHIILSDILQGAGHIDDILPYFLRHAKEIFPHLDCMEDLKKISDLRLPSNWYPEARAMERKIVYHAGPTNSGKTYQALQRFMNAKSGIYCGPLKLLASEVFHKANASGTPCDLVTGEERIFVDPEQNRSNHVSCTVEMTSITTPYEVAIIDEIQMAKDPQRGWAWTRALLGICAEEIHVCGEAAAIDIVKELMVHTGDEIEVRKYKRLTNLQYEKEALGSLDKVRPGDCIVCFSKNDIYAIIKHIEKLGHEVAVIYGGLPPATKLAQAAKFNDPKSACKILVATDAIGMGLNLSIKRLIFYSLVKPTLNEKGEKEIDYISTSQALQIGGRAGRYGTQYSDGLVTAFKKQDLCTLQEIVSRPVEIIEKVGLHPTIEQMEMFAYHLPKASLSNLMDIFVIVSRLDNDAYFMCNVDDFKFMADMIEHIPLSMRTRYVFCCSPIPKTQPFTCSMFIKFARHFSKNEALTFDWVCKQIGWPFLPPETIADLVHLEGVFDVLDLYLWLSYRFDDMFPDTQHIRDMQSEVDQVIQRGIFNITKLLKNSETLTSSGTPDNEDDFEIKKRNWGASHGMAPLIESDDKLAGDDSAIYGKDSSTDPQKSLDDNTGVTEKVLKQGIISRETLLKLHQEWAKTFRKNIIPTSNNK